MELESRMTKLEDTFREHVDFDRKEHAKFAVSLAQNTALTQQVANNTTELVELVKGAKGLRRLIIWIAPIVAIGYELWQWLKSHWN